MSSKENLSEEKKYNKWIVVLAIVIPLVVAILSRLKLQDFGIEVEPLTFLPPIYAAINGLTAINFDYCFYCNKKQEFEYFTKA